MSNNFVGRTLEQQKLRKALTTGESEMIAVIGRRRVGKTFLIKETYAAELAFEVTGLQDVTLEKQLQHFSFTLSRYRKSTAIPVYRNWLEAFQQLVIYLEELPTMEGRVVFFDEVPWLATQKSDFLTGLGFFWNSWAVNKNMVVVICGSAASWMIDNLINNRGGLYNRITKRIFLYPFTLAETEAYFQQRHIGFSRYQIVELYLALGGIPHHLKEVESGKSAVQNIESICFSRNGLLFDEFSNLYFSLFARADRHIAVIRALATVRQGLTRSKIIQLGQLSEGGSTTKVLEELEKSGFITAYYPFGKKKKGRLYRLTDEYSLFFLKFMEDKSNEGERTWQHLSQTQTYKTWSGYAYENLCLKHIQQIKKSLDIAGIYSSSSSFYKKGTTQETGTQIDLLLDRNDDVINLFEIKYYNTEVTVTKSFAQNLRTKMRVFRESTRTNKYIMPVLLTTFGLKPNMHSLGLIEKVLTLDDLFVE